MKNSIFLLLTLCFLCQCSCKKSILANDDDDNPPMTELEKLPPITSEGANTFGCLVNGEAWTPGGFSFPDPIFNVYYAQVFDGISFTMRRVSNFGDTTSIYEYLTFSTTGYETDEPYIRRANLRELGSCPDYYPYDSLLNQNLAISVFDTINHIVAGTFDFIVTIEEDEDCVDTLYVTDGRFDAVYWY